MGTELCNNFLAGVSIHKSGEKILVSRERKWPHCEVDSTPNHCYNKLQDSKHQSPLFFTKLKIRVSGVTISWRPPCYLEANPLPFPRDKNSVVGFVPSRCCSSSPEACNCKLWSCAMKGIDLVCLRTQWAPYPPWHHNAPCCKIKEQCRRGWLFPYFYWRASSVCPNWFSLLTSWGVADAPILQIQGFSRVLGRRCGGCQCCGTVERGGGEAHLQCKSCHIQKLQSLVTPTWS
jgi:hypothetical protein